MQGKGSNHSRIDRITDYLNDTAKGVNILRHYNHTICHIVDFLLKHKDKTIFTCGNGGSSSAASHMVNDLMINGGLNVQCLSDNVPTITAMANDISYEDIYSSQLEILAEEGDVLIIFSGSGNSRNIVKAIQVAIDKKMRIIACIGTNGGKIISDYKRDIDFLIHIKIPMSNYEDSSIVFIHILMDLLRKSHA